jgi:hypothetical protein
VKRKPTLATWTLDASDSFALTDHKTRKLLIFVAQTPKPLARRHTIGANDASTVSPSSNFLPNLQPFSDMDEMVPGTGDVMFSAGLINSSSGGFMMPPEAFGGSDAFLYSDMVPGIPGSQSSTNSDDTHDNMMLVDFDINDFIHDAADSTDEDEDDESGSATGVEDSPSTSRRQSASTLLSHEDGGIHPLLEHLGNVGVGGVGAFRRNQNHHRLITRNNESYESLAFSGPTHEGTLRGVKHGKLAAVNTPMTPMRKTKAKLDFSTMPQFTEPSPSQANSKRKFSGEQSGHKRNRSMF